MIELPIESVEVAERPSGEVKASSSKLIKLKKELSQIRDEVVKEERKIKSYHSMLNRINNFSATYGFKDTDEFINFYLEQNGKSLKEDCAKKESEVHVRRKARAKLTLQLKKEIYKVWSLGQKSAKEIGEQFNIAAVTVYHIGNQKKYSS